MKKNCWIHCEHLLNKMCNQQFWNVLNKIKFNNNHYYKIKIIIYYFGKKTQNIRKYKTDVLRNERTHFTAILKSLKYELLKRVRYFWVIIKNTYSITVNKMFSFVRIIIQWAWLKTVVRPIRKLDCSNKQIEQAVLTYLEIFPVQHNETISRDSSFCFKRHFWTCGLSVVSRKGSLIRWIFDGQTDGVYTFSTYCRSLCKSRSKTTLLSTQQLCNQYGTHYPQSSGKTQDPPNFDAYHDILYFSLKCMYHGRTAREVVKSTTRLLYYFNNIWRTGDAHAYTERPPLVMNFVSSLYKQIIFIIIIIISIILLAAYRTPRCRE